MTLIEKINSSPTIPFHSIFQHVTVEGLFLEFGVHKGGSIRGIAELNPDRMIYGFDSFEGLPEDWKDDSPKGRFACDIPTDLPKNVELVVGLFQHTLEDFIRINNRPISFIHIDCDLYSSTKYIFDALKNNLREGTVIAFDEIYGFPGWEEFEYKAFVEFLEENEMDIETLGKYGTNRAAFVLKRKKKTFDRDGLRGFTASAFDLLHPGHIAMLQQCKEHCEHLIVGLHTNPSIDRPTEKNRPLQSVYERYKQLQGCKYVDEIIPYDTEQDLINILSIEKIDVRFVGEEYKLKRLTGHDICDRRYIRIIYNTRIHNYSSSELRNRIK